MIRLLLPMHYWHVSYILYVLVKTQMIEKIKEHQQGMLLIDWFFTKWKEEMNLLKRRNELNQLNIPISNSRFTVEMEQFLYLQKAEEKEYTMKQKQKKFHRSRLYKLQQAESLRLCRFRHKIADS